MKIGIDATALYGRYGGVEYALWNLLGALNAIEQTAALRHKWVIYVPQDGPSAEQTKAFDSHWQWRRLPFRGSEKWKRIAWQQGVLAKAAERDGCEVLHCPTYVCPLRANLPIVLTIYDFIALTHPHFATPLNRAHYGWMLPRCARRAARIMVPSEPVRRELVRRVPEAGARCVVVPLGVEADFGQSFSEEQLQAARKTWNLPPRFVLFVGNAEPKKNARAILEAMKLLPAALREIPLVVSGGARAWQEWEIGTSSQTLLKSAPPTNASLEPRTLSLGYIERGDLPLLYALCDAFVFPSLAEGFGLPVLEALAGGAPVIASDRVPLADLETAAIVVEPHDVKALAQQLEILLSDAALRADLSARGRRFAQPYSWQRTAQMTLDVYASLGAK